MLILQSDLVYLRYFAYRIVCQYLWCWPDIVPAILLRLLHCQKQEGGLSGSFCWFPPGDPADPLWAIISNFCSPLRSTKPRCYWFSPDFTSFARDEDEPSNKRVLAIDISILPCVRKRAGEDVSVFDEPKQEYFLLFFSRSLSEEPSRRDSSTFSSSVSCSPAWRTCCARRWCRQRWTAGGWRAEDCGKCTAVWCYWWLCCSELIICPRWPAVCSSRPSWLSSSGRSCTTMPPRPPSCTTGSARLSSTFR